MTMLLFFLVVAAIVLVLASAAGKCPLWVGVFLGLFVMAVERWPWR